MAAALDTLTVLNEQLAALAEAGVPLDLGLGGASEQTAHKLAQVTSTVARRTALGEPLNDALEGDEYTAPLTYRSMVQVGLRSGRPSAAFDRANHLAVSIDQSRYAIWNSLGYPLVLCLMAYAGLIGFCLVLVPRLAKFHDSLRIPIGWGLGILQSLRSSLPVWIWIPPLAALLWLAWSFSRRWRVSTALDRPGSLMRLIPGMSGVDPQLRSANFADSLATLLENEVSFDEAIKLAANSAGDAQLIEGARALSAALRTGGMPGYDSQVANLFPPFLRWSLWHAEPTGVRVGNLRTAAAVYRDAAERRVERLRLLAPIVACVLVGGGATLLYGLALFVPVIEMLNALAGAPVSYS